MAAEAVLLSETLSPSRGGFADEQESLRQALDHQHSSHGDRPNGILRRWLSGGGLNWSGSGKTAHAASNSKKDRSLEITAEGLYKAERRIALNSSGYSPSLSSSNNPHLTFFSGRPVIRDGSKVGGGVYLSPKPVEAVVMDTRCGYLWGVLQELFRNRLPEAIAQRNPAEILAAVFFLVRETLPLDDRKVASLLRQKQFVPDQKVSIELFLVERCASPRHQVLLAAFLMERLCQGMLLRGEFFIRHRKPLLEEVLIFRSDDGTDFTFAPGF